MNITRARQKVGLIGTGLVGASFAYSLMQSGLANELVLIDADHGRAEGEAMDLNHGLPFVGPMRIYAGEYADLADADVIVICAGANQRPGETRLDLLKKNAQVFRDITPKIQSVNQHAILVIATNPVDILSYISATILGVDSGRVIGSGTVLDTARFRYLLGTHYGIDPRSVHAYIVGEHGDSELALWSTANIGGVSLETFAGVNGQGYDANALEHIFQQTRNAAYEIIQRKKATYYAIGLGLLSIVEAVLRDQHTVMTVSSPLQGQFAMRDMASSLPTIVGKHGIERVLDIPMNEQEQAAFVRSVTLLKQNLAALDDQAS